MTIATEAIVAGPFTGNGVNTTFSFAFKVFADSDVLVVHTSVAGLDNTAVLNTDYLVTRNADQDNSPGGSITWRVAGVTTPLPSGEKVVISSQVPNTQQTALPTGGKYAAKTVERMIDKCVILIKQFGRSVARTVRQPLSDATVMNELPNALNRRGRFLYFEDTVAAHPTAVAVLSSTSVAISPYMLTLLDDPDSASARTTLGVSAVQPSNFIATNLFPAVDAAAARLAIATVASAGTPANLALAAALGAATDAARADHVHQRPLESIVIAASDETTGIAAGVGKVTFRMPYAFTLTDVRASLTTAQATGASLFTVDVNEGGVSILSTKLTFDNTEKTTTTAATARVISDTSLADDAEISVDVDLIGDGTAKGLKVTLIGRQT